MSLQHSFHFAAPGLDHNIPRQRLQWGNNREWSLETGESEGEMSWELTSDVFSTHVVRSKSNNYELAFVCDFDNFRGTKRLKLDL